MPILNFRVQAEDFTEEQLDELARGATRVAADAEQIPDDETHRRTTVVVIDVVPRGRVYMGGARSAVPFVAIEVCPPSGVLDQAARNGLYIALERVVQSAAGARGPALTSVIIRDVDHGHWGIGGQVNWLNDFVARAGYEHLAR